MSFVEPLIVLLTGDEPSVHSPAARALAMYKVPEVTDKIVKIALNSTLERQVRQASLISLGRMLDKRAVDCLIKLLDDPDPAMSKSAQDSLAELTNVRSMDIRDWKKWWRKNKNKNRDQWVADLTDSLVQAKLDLEADNITLRKKLAQTTRDLYAATPTARKDALLVKMLNDEIVGVRLVGLEMVDRRISENATVSDPIRSQIRVMLSDKSPEIRQGSVMVIAHLADGESLKALLAGLAVEVSSEVVVAMLKAVGQLRDPSGADAVVKRISSNELSEVIAAAGAITRIARAKPLEDAPRGQAVKALGKKYAVLTAGKNNVVAREALLTAMGVVADKSFLKPMISALKDEDASVRRAAITALGQVNGSDIADELVPFTSDPDHGVRQAAISALGKRDGRKHLKVILRRSDPKVESQPSVRTQAWAVAMEILTDGSIEESRTAVLAEALGYLSGREDSPDLRIKIMVLYVERLRAEKSPKLPHAQLLLAETLLITARPGEAAKHLQEVYKTFLARKDAKSAEAWQLLVESFLQANDSAGVDLLAKQENDEAFSEGITRLQSRLAELSQAKDYAAIIILSQLGIEKLGTKILPSELREIKQYYVQADMLRLEQDRIKVVEFVTQIIEGDDAAKAKANIALRAMESRAIKPLLLELKKTISSKTPSTKIEQAILEVLAQLAPTLTGYKIDSPIKSRIALIDTWLSQ